MHVFRFFGVGVEQAHFKSLGKPAPPVVMKDIIVHPMQMAQALEKGAAATVLIACVVRQQYSINSNTPF